MTREYITPYGFTMMYNGIYVPETKCIPGWQEGIIGQLRSIRFKASSIGINLSWAETLIQAG